MVTVGSLFSGIGGLDLGLERAGFAVRWQVEIEPYNRAALAKHWPDVPRFEDVRAFPPQEANLSRLRVDVVVGGFPCQDVSVAGSRRGIGAGTRSGLWSEFLRIVALLRPAFVVVENTPGLLAPIRRKRKFVAPAPIGRVLGELSEVGFDAEWATVPLSAFGSPHRRERVFIVAYPAGFGGGSRCLPERQGAEGEGAIDAEGTGGSNSADALCVGAGRKEGQSRRFASVRQGPKEQAHEQGVESANAHRQRSLFEDGAEAEQGGDGTIDGLPVGDGCEAPCADVNVGAGGQGAAPVAQQGGSRASSESDRRDSPFVGSGWWGAEPDVVRMVHGIPRRLVRPAISGLGNAVAPQQAEWIGRHLFAFIKQHGA